MKLRSNRVFNRGKPKINIHIKKQTFSERRLSLRSSKSNVVKGISEGKIGSCVDDCDENVEVGTKEMVNIDDKGLFLGSEVLDPVEDLVVSCPKKEDEEGEGNGSVSINLSETGLGFEEEVRSPNIDCENGYKSLESETFVDDTTILNGCEEEVKSPHVDCDNGFKSLECETFVDDTDKETSLDNTENPNLLGECKEMKSSVVCENGSKSLECETFVNDITFVNSVDKETSLDDPMNPNLLGECKEMKSSHVCENGSKSLECEIFVDDTTIVNSVDKETLLDDPGNANILGNCKEMKEKGKCGRKKKKVGNLKNVKSIQEKIDVVTGTNDDDECTHKPLKRKREKKRKKVGALGSECNGRVESEKVEKESVLVTGRVLRSSGEHVDGEFRSVVLGIQRPDDIPNETLELLERPKVVTDCENKRPKKKLKRCARRKLQGTSSGGAFVMDDGGFRSVVPGLKHSDDIPKKMLKRRGRPRKVVTEGEKMRPKKKLKRRGRPCKLQGDIKPLPPNEIPIKKVERRGRPRKVPLEVPAGPGKSCGVEQKLNGKGIAFKKLKHRPKMEAESLATRLIKTRKVKSMSVKKSSKVCKTEKSEENSIQIMGTAEFVNVGKRKSYRKELKQLIRDKISNLLLKCGWIIDLKQRQEKSYLDAVYIEPDKKRSHWSITGAYAKLKSKVENGKADDNEMSAFTPIPEEEISMLFRQRRKERKKHKKRILKNVKKGKSVTDKKKKKHGKKSKDGSKRKLIFKPRILVGSKQDNEGVLVIKKRNLLTWMIDSGVILVGTKVQYGKTRRQKRSSEGIITNDGICCSCCNETMGITKFVGHCGGKFGQVFDNLYLESGVCLRKCLMDSWRKEEESDTNRFNVVDIQGDDPNDDACNICGDGGDLICCDGCPSTFHQSCLNVENFPSGDWNCIYCTCKFCGVVSISTPQAEDSHDEVTSQMLSCRLCEEKFHQVCVQEVENVNSDSNGLPFCGSKCQEVFERLQTYLGVKHELEDGFSWTLLQRSGVDQDCNVLDTQLRVEHNSKLAVAFSVMDECFVPIVDERSGTSIIRNVVYNCGSNFKRLNYAGFLTAVLEKDDEFITAASIRIHGYRVAEMPFIGTRHIYRRQGMCRRLLDAIESTLSSLGVEELIIPAIPALLQTWTDVFGFMPLEDTKKQAMKSMSMMVFPGIEMLRKPLLQNQSADVDNTTSTGVVKDVLDHEQKEETILLMDGCSSPKPDDVNNTQVETTSSNATDHKQTSADTADVVNAIIDNKQTEKETVLVDSCSRPDLENDKLSHGVNSFCDLNLPVKNVLPCDIDGQTSVDSESFQDCAIEPSSLESMVCGNPESLGMKLDVEDDGVPGVNVKPSLMSSKLVLKNSFDLNLQPTTVETDTHIIGDDSVQCESRACVKLFELSDSRSHVDQNAGGQTDSKICETQPLVIR